MYIYLELWLLQVVLGFFTLCSALLCLLLAGSSHSCVVTSTLRPAVKVAHILLHAILEVRQANVFVSQRLTGGHSGAF